MGGRLGATKIIHRLLIISGKLTQAKHGTYNVFNRMKNIQAASLFTWQTTPCRTKSKPHRW